MKPQISLFGIIVMLLTTVALGQTVERTHDIIPEDYFSQVFLSGVEASPDGEYTAFVDYRWDKENDRRSHDIWVVENDTQELQRLTFDPGNEGSPQWSLDSKSLYFIGHIKQGTADAPPYDGSTQVWRINVDGSDLFPITRIPDGIYDYQLAPDGESIWYTRTKEYRIEEWGEMRSQYTNVEYGHGIYEVSELWQLDLTSWRDELIFDPKLHIHEFAVSSNNKHIAMITTVDGESISMEGWSDVTVLDRSNGDSYDLYDQLWREDAPSPHGWLGGLTWTDDGNKLAFTVDFDGYPSEIIVSDFSERAAQIQRVTRPDGVHVAGGLNWVPGEDAIAFIGDNRARARVYSVNLEDSSSETLTPGDVVVNGFTFAGDDGDLVAIQSELTYYQDLVLYKGRNETTHITHLNPQVDTWKLPQISIVEWEGANGDMVEGILELPPDYEPGQKLPLLLTLHGGPTLAEPYCFLFWIYGRASFAAKGYAMLSPNYRGSTGFGDKFMTDLIGHENDWDVKDIMAGVDYLIAEGIVDEDQMAVSGWSNGGFLTNCLISTNRFKAASTGAGVLDMTMQLVEEDTPGHVINFTEGLPWEVPGEYQDASPLYSLKPGITTAVLIHVGENDPRVPATQSIGLHRMLWRYLDVPCELIIYPGAGHNLTKYSHRLAKAKWDHAWIDYYTLKK
ncbi:prolyl tripeptidyl peptidase precursor [bacterium BMS3Bbin04]|nr:prolyl tripeptidyl peptidase precursor [bacterium BMS3Bbin04]